MLSAPADLSAKKPGAVTLSLPADLLTVIRQEAAKLGLGKAAKKTDVTATLHGDGYTVTPPGPQTAPLTPGKPTTFTWQVAPGPNAKGPLTADVNAALKGAGDAKTFTLAKLNQAVAAVDAAVKAAEASHGFKFPSLDMLSIPGHKDVALPVVGKTPSKSIVGALIVLAILFLLALFARGSTARRDSAASRRRYRTMAATPAMGLAEPEPHVEHVLAPAVEHAHAMEHPNLADHHAHEPAAPAHYEEPHMAVDHHGDEHAHADDHHAVDAADHHADDHGTPDSPVADQVHDDHHAHAEPVAHAADPDVHAPADHHAAVEPVVDHHAEAPVGDYVPIGDHGEAHGADHHEVVHVAGEPVEAHAAAEHGGDHQAHDNLHHGADAHHHLELESI